MLPSIFFRECPLPLLAETNGKEGCFMPKDHEYEFLPDSRHEGRDKYFIDVDRMVNEGMSGGYVFSREDRTNIEEASEFFPEDPPQNLK